MSVKYLCLNCIQTWTAELKKPIDEACFKCGKRMAIPLHEFEKTVSIYKRWIEEFKKYNPTASPFYFPSVLEFPYGLQILDKIIIIASEYNCETENIEDCLNRLKSKRKL